jgi:hypothetical protein
VSSNNAAFRRRFALNIDEVLSGFYDRHERARMESMPFLHENQVFTLTFEEDLSFVHTRTILDYLILMNAFDPSIQEERGVYDINVDASVFKVWVTELEVIVQRVSALC